MNQTLPAPSRRRGLLAVALALLVALAGIGAPLSASADDTVLGSVSGVATDAISGDPIVGAPIQLGGQFGFFNATTDASGAYSMVDLPLGDYQLSAYGTTG